MNRTAVILIAAGSLLSGCVAYETPTGAVGYSGSGSYYSTDGRVYVSGGTGPHYTSDGRAYYSREGQHYYQRRDRDGDGVPNRQDRDRDGDGVRNSQDRAPDNPRRY